jgi:hypothetical protein
VPRKFTFLCVLLLTLSTSAFAQNANDLINRFRGVVQGAIVHEAQFEWKKLPLNEIGCIDQALRQQNSSIDALINRGVLPSDPRLAQLRANCRGQVAQSPQPTTAQASPYVVDGLPLYGHVRFDSQAYQQYQCSPSDKFPGFTWCHKEKTEKTNRGEVILSNSILHTQDGTAVYVNRYIEPAFFGPNEVQSEIDRLSAKFGQPTQKIQMPEREGLPHAIIVVWGGIRLEPLNTDDVAIIASGGSHEGILVSFLGDLQQSAKAGVPMYKLAGGAGFLWAATFNDNGRGVLRFLTTDASQYESTPRTATNPPCIAASPGPGYQSDGTKYLITPESFAADIDIVNQIKSLYGDRAEIADWQTLKGLLSTKQELAKFIEKVGIPVQAQNGPCDNFLVSMNGDLRRENGLRLFFARHDGKVPNNWAVLDSIDNHTLDLGRWSWKSQALVVIPEDTANPPIVATTNPSTQPPPQTRREPPSHSELCSTRKS